MATTINNFNNLLVRPRGVSADAVATGFVDRGVSAARLLAARGVSAARGMSVSVNQWR